LNALNYTKHALQRMREFDIEASDVERAVRYYDTCVPAKRGCRNYFKHFGQHLLRITVYTDGEKLWIVTVWKETA